MLKLPQRLPISNCSSGPNRFAFGARFFQLSLIWKNVERLGHENLSKPPRAHREMPILLISYVPRPYTRYRFDNLNAPHCLKIWLLSVLQSLALFDTPNIRQHWITQSLICHFSPQFSWKESLHEYPRFSGGWFGVHAEEFYPRYWWRQGEDFQWPRYGGPLSTPNSDPHMDYFRGVVSFRPPDCRRRACF